MIAAWAARYARSTESSEEDDMGVGPSEENWIATSDGSEEVFLYSAIAALLW